MIPFVIISLTHQLTSFLMINSFLPRPVPISRRTLPFSQCWNASPINSEAYGHCSFSAGASPPICPNGTIASAGTTSSVFSAACLVVSASCCISVSSAVRVPIASGTFPSAASGTASSVISGPSSGTLSGAVSIAFSGASPDTPSNTLSTPGGLSNTSSNTVPCGMSGALSGSIVQGISLAACSVARVAAFCASSSARLSSGDILFQRRNLPISSSDSCIVIFLGSLE